ncbi:DNA repair protein RadA [Candidatus Woesebacteria bacterium RIFCSPHIGHO2_02_FULL_38_9]|uniref:DNA repair protein RadA n=1 Tax=Candidatus Woesebacteria bacterium RIFCSPHIGHO2_01_FULL_39_28 TaxID=1802496 RepID=A0A1F7Y8U5_9BACT|nr:MAG: DNA repair protein RadA [Candidatus Woesebacteria bacterium RIFCSPHIGHO2_01_FULL_39_28]OGM34578.1 MAG: DNA repair protein RadA [Candidatus Woesebacteria bacterium RIFCSPHIGHO2_02_FULL_38_9]
MSKSHSQYVCQQCGYSQVGWAGKCPNCGSWSSLVETVISSSISTRKNGSTIKQLNNKPISLSSIPSKSTLRISTKISELDRVLGGGLVPGQVVLLAGEPGIGKSTILLQLSDNLGNVLYVSGEESGRQIKIRADRLGIKSKGITLLEETDIDSVNQLINDSINQFSTVIIDSIQTMTTSDLSGMAGSVGQVRECTFRLVRLAKSKNIPVFLVGHVTKEGTVAGPAVLAHIVDTILWFEGDKTKVVRFLRAVKNRFGPTDEVGIFAMEETGLISMDNPQKLFLENGKKVAGSIVSSVMEGTRPLLIEVQSLVVPTKMPYPKRVAQGIDSKRFELLLAILTRRCGLPLGDFDCFVNVVGGVVVREPAIDLAVCLSLASSFLDKPIDNKTVAIGEVGLSGEIRGVVLQEKRIKEAKRLGFNNFITNHEAEYLNQAIKILQK